MRKFLGTILGTILGAVKDTYNAANATSFEAVSIGKRYVSSEAIGAEILSRATILETSGFLASRCTVRALPALELGAYDRKSGAEKSYALGSKRITVNTPELAFAMRVYLSFHGDTDIRRASHSVSEFALYSACREVMESVCASIAGISVQSEYGLNGVKLAPIAEKRAEING